MGKLHDYLEKSGLENCEVSLLFLKLNFKAKQSEQTAAWTLFVELVTRITTQNLPDDAGVEKRALDSLYEFFTNARSILVQHGRTAQDFSVLTVYVLNHLLRPFLAVWHKKSNEGAFTRPRDCADFRKELKGLQKELRACAFCLADGAGVDPAITAKLL